MIKKLYSSSFSIQSIIEQQIVCSANFANSVYAKDKTLINGSFDMITNDEVLNNLNVVSKNKTKIGK